MPEKRKPPVAPTREELRREEPREARLTDYETMLDALWKIECAPDIRQQLFPQLLESAGQNLGAYQLVGRIMHAVGDFTTDSFAILDVDKIMPQIIDAMVTDPAVRAQAKRFYKASLSG